MTDLERRLRRVRAAVAERRLREARDLADRALAEASAVPALGVLAALVARDLGRPGAGDALAAALQAGQGWSEDRVAAWVAVAEDADARRLWAEADAAWAEAVSAGGGSPELLLGRAGALLRAGRQADALPLFEALTTAEDSALSLAAWLVLSGMWLADWKLSQADRAAEKAQELARSRHNWLAFSAAVIDRSEVRVRRQDPDGALTLLVDALRVVRERGDPGALLVARVHEVRGS